MKNSSNKDIVSSFELMLNNPVNSFSFISVFLGWTSIEHSIKHFNVLAQSDKNCTRGTDVSGSALIDVTKG